jgi:hypothetical protein
VGKRTAAVIADYSNTATAPRIWVTKATPRIQGYDDAKHHDVGLDIELEMQSAPPGTRQATKSWKAHLVLACGSELIDEGTRLWTCRSLEIGIDGGACPLVKWHPPTVETACGGTRPFSAPGHQLGEPGRFRAQNISASLPKARLNSPGRSSRSRPEARDSLP